MPARLLQPLLPIRSAPWQLVLAVSLTAAVAMAAFIAQTDNFAGRPTLSTFVATSLVVFAALFGTWWIGAIAALAVAPSLGIAFETNHHHPAVLLVEMIGFLSFSTLLVLVTRHISRMHMRRAGLAAELSEQSDSLRIALTAGKMTAFDWEPGKDSRWSGSLEITHGVHLAPGDMRGYVDLLHPEDRDHFQKEIERVLGSGGSFLIPHRIIRPDDGSVRWMESRGEALVDPKAAGDPSRPVVSRVTGVVTDVTAQRLAAAELEAQRLRYRDLFDHSFDLVFVADTEGKMEIISQTHEEILGYSLTELAGIYPGELLADDVERENLARTISDFKESDALTTSPTLRRYLTKSGEIRLIQTQAKKIFDHEGKFANMLVHGRDVTDQLTTEFRFQQMIETAVAGVALLDRNGVIDFTNSQFARWIGEVPGTAEGLRLIDWVHPEDRHMMAEAHEAALARKEQPELHEFRLCVGDNIAWVRGAIRQVAPTESGHAAMLIAIDVSDKHNVAERLAELSRDMQTVLDSTTEGIVSLYSDGIVRFINPAGAQMLGISIADELAGPKRSIHDFVTHRLPDGALCTEETCPLRRVATTGERYESAYNESFISTKGHEFPVAYTCDPMFNPDGTNEGLVVSFKDVSERRALEDRLAHSERLEATGLLAGGVAHDFNNVMTIVRTASDLILSQVESGSDPWKEALEIRKAVDAAAAMTQQLLTFSSKDVIKPRPISLAAVLNESLSMIRRSVTSNISIAIEDQPTSAVVADPNQITQALINLVMNAADSMESVPTGWLTISTGEADFTEEELQKLSFVESDTISAGRYVTLTVSDNGEGMTPETISNLFVPFFTTKEGGTGLGLATVYGAVRRTGGTIHVESVPGEGSTFTLLFPASDAEVQDAPLESSDRGVVASSSIAQNGKAHILLVEDNPGVRLVTEMMLKKLGYRVTAFADPVDAIQRAKSLDYALLLSDVVMPIMSGVTLAQALRDENPEIKVLLMSGFIKDADVAQIADTPGVAFLSKPFSEEQISSSLQQLLVG